MISYKILSDNKKINTYNKIKDDAMKEEFSPLGYTQNCPAAEVVSPTFVMPRKGGDTKMINVPGLGIITNPSVGLAVQGKPLKGKGCPNKQEMEENERLLKKGFPPNQPLGAGATMTGPWGGYNGCIDNVNGVNKPSYENPYGETVPLGKQQMYGMCVEGIPNAFDFNPNLQEI